jgi:hypothetical protein
MLTHDEMTLHYRDASSDTAMRDACLEDIERFFINGAWWKGSRGEQFKNKPKPEFNKLWRAINRVVGDINDMELNAVIVSNSDDATDEDADLLQKRWRNDFQSSDGIEASEIATMESAIGGFGCTKLVAKYEDEESPDPNAQYLCAEIIHSACTSVFFGVEAIRKDKSDARRGWHLIRVSRKAIEEEYGVNVTSFMNNASHTVSKLDIETQRDIYLAHYYEVVEKNLTVYDFSQMNGLKITAGDGITDDAGGKYTREDLKEIREIYADIFGEEAPTMRRKIKYVEYALADGEKYLTKPQRTPFKRIPLFPRYGYHAVINGQEFYCGEVRKQLDAEMFHNMFGSTLMEIMAAPQISKPEYTPEQIQRHAAQRARADIDNVPFLMSDPIKDANNTPIHFGPIGMSQPPQIGTGLATAGQFLAGNIMEMGGAGQATVPSNSSGEAIQQVNERTDDAFLPIVKNVLHSIKAQCEGWIPAAQTLYFTNQRRLRVQESDGNYTQVTTLEMTEREDGSYGPYGNTAKGRYSVQVEKGEAYKDQREAERQSITDMLQYAGSDTEFGQLMLMNAMTLTSGEGGSRMRQVARYKTIDLMMAMAMPFEPDNEEEAQYIQSKQQQMTQQSEMAAQNDPIMIQARAQEQLAQAEMIKAQADMMDKQVDTYNAETDRMKVMIDAKRYGADIEIKQAKLQVDMARDLRKQPNTQP